MSEINVAEVEAKLALVFSNKDILREAFLSHALRGEAPSPNRKFNNPLAYLGDAVIECIIRDCLLDGVEFPFSIVESLGHYLRTDFVYAKVAREIGLGHLSAKASSLQDEELLSVKTLGSLYEALVGAIFRDQGMSAAKEFVKRTLLRDVVSHIREVYRQKPQLFLSCYLQKMRRTNMTIETTDAGNGRMSAHVTGGGFSETATGSTKVVAIQIASRKILRRLGMESSEDVIREFREISRP